MEIDQELFAEFLTESLQGLQSIEQDLLTLESQGATDKEIVNRVFRVVHTMKGTGGYMSLDDLVKLSHLAETLLDEVRSGKREATPPVVDAILAAVDELAQMLNSPTIEADLSQSEAVRKLEAVLGMGPSGGDNRAARASGGSWTPDWQKVESNWNKKLFLFLIQTDLSTLHSAIDIKEGVVAGLSSVGKIIDASIDAAQIDTSLEGPVEFVFETVLDSDLISNYLNIDPSKITKVDPKAQKEKAASELPPSPPAKQTTEAAVATPTSPDLKKPTKEESGADPDHNAKPAAGAKANADQSMRISVAVLNELLEWTGTMVMARNQLLNQFDFHGNIAFRTLSQAISGVHEKIIATRMQTTGTLFERYRRVVRDLSRQLGKEVALHIEGGHLELDRSILESFADPLTHLIRNCMDHALETPAEREAANKNRQGNVFLRSYIQSGEIILEVEDDGRGISADIVCKKAVSKGVITADEAARMSEKEKIMLIFKPGFSTKEAATAVSGRGVGMDVVKSNIEAVGGSIDISTTVGQGTKFSAILPLAKALVSSSLTKALIVELDGEQFAIPETAVSEIIRFDEKAKASLQSVDAQAVFHLRDQLVAIVDLHATLELTEPGHSSAKPSGNAKSKYQDTPPDGNQCIVIFQFRKNLFGAIVDNVVGINEIIVRSTPKLLQNCTMYSGHTVLGTGHVALILDINGIVQKLGLKFEDPSQKAGKLAADSLAMEEVSKGSAATQKMLVFSYASNEYFAIPLELIAIIERIRSTDIKTVGEKEYLQLKQETISILRLDKYLPIGRMEADRKDLCLVRAAAIPFPIGLIIGADVSVVDVADTFETRVNDSKGILGTFVHNNKLVMILDLYSLFEKHAPDKLAQAPIEITNARILVAEDSLFFRKLIEQYVKSDLWDVEIVNDGLEAWEKLQHEPNRYNLIISDINMPRMDGFEFAMKVRDDRRFDSLPMVALTTLSEDHYRKRGMSVGFDRYVIKIDKMQVRNTVAECLKIKRSGRA
ncbi:hybrid sensor histidine kinase/response regulator [Pirellulaceae bacterium SH501]